MLFGELVGIISPTWSAAFKGKTLKHLVAVPRDAHIPEFDATGIHECGCLLKIGLLSKLMVFAPLTTIGKVFTGG